MRMQEVGPNKGKPCQISQYIIVREYMRTHGIPYVNDGECFHKVLAERPDLSVDNFTQEQLNLSLDDFSRELGWMG